MESDYPDILAGTFDSKMTFQKHLRSVSKAASQSLGIWTKSWRVFLEKTSQYRRTFSPLSVSLWNDLCDPVFDGVGLAGFKSWANAFLLA